MWQDIVWVLAGVAAVYTLANTAAFLFNLRPLRPRKDITSGDTLLIVVAHQDDEAIIAGGAMARTVGKGGNVHVVYTADGVTRGPSLTEDAARARIARRESESLACLADLGIPRENAHFLRCENQEGLTEPPNVMRAVDHVAELIKELEPYAILTSAFEGGHCDHDMTHLIVSRAAETARFPFERIFEAPEYNRYYLRDYLLRKLNDILLIKINLPPRFTPTVSSSFALDMTRGEIARKRRLFGHFGAQKPERLAARFGFPDQFRPLSRPDYAKGPYDPRESLRYRFIDSWKHKDKAPFYGGLTSEDYRKVYDRLEEERLEAGRRR